MISPPTLPTHIQCEFEQKTTNHLHTMHPNKYDDGWYEGSEFQKKTKNKAKYIKKLSQILV